ncbi:LysR family transcriptional regulator [Vibrio sp. SCSIO 43135]|uniref:LysR family transcriptional regulator n=1 Tax=Vibrio sp. SCSIO 43135 TaxID=2819096 RepID=UPI002074AE50|nr:LysR family transcriptional regulator [Vibrio sp. SCSIO 43135]USD43380.1 LysR family transcriptional regulator [Vibrio sp. SCSIO 43135]
MIDQLDAIPSIVPKLLVQLEKMGSVSLAANALRVSQPAASKALQRAEAVLGLSLVNRDTRPLSLSAEGALIAEYSKQQQHREQALLRQLRMIQKGAGVVKIASFGASATTHILPSIIHKLRRHAPNITIEISEHSDEDALAAVRDGRVDFAIVVDTQEIDLDIIPVFTDRLMALVHQDDPFAQHSVLCAQDIASRDFILTKGGSERLIREWFHLAGVQPNVKHSALQLTSILALIRAQLGITVVAELAIPESHPNVKVVPLTPEYPRRICLARRHGSFSSHAAKSTWQYLDKNMTFKHLTSPPTQSRFK